VLGIELVLITGEILRIGGKHLDSEAYDLLGLLTGSEGLLGVITEVTVRILRKPRRRAPCWSAFPAPSRPATAWRASSGPASSPAAWR
jgi:glycolate oxidase